MKISPVCVNNYKVVNKIRFQQCKTNPQFRGKHDTAKFLGGLCGTLGTLGATVGTILMTGGIALPFVLGYGALSAGSGAVVGHLIDKGNPDYDKQK